jgi:hypothetical protein
MALSNSNPPTQNTELIPPTEGQQMVDCEVATREIMGVFDDPIFNTPFSEP